MRCAADGVANNIHPITALTDRAKTGPVAQANPRSNNHGAQANPRSNNHGTQANLRSNNHGTRTVR